MRVGMGYDVHAFKAGRKLILGGVDIPFELGLDGHSDADVLVHALMDAMLGTLALGDIGKLFSDTDESYKGADSMKLLSHVAKLINDRGYHLVNADCIIVAQKPKLANYIDAMRQNIADVLCVSVDDISIKATTEERLGFTGDLSGVKAYCTCLVDNNK